MPTALDRLKELSELLRQLLLMDATTLQSPLEEGFLDSPPEWINRLARARWANRLLLDIKSSSELLDERLTSPGTVKTVRASIKIGPITIRPVTPEEKEELRRAREEGDSEQSE